VGHLSCWEIQNLGGYNFPESGGGQIIVAVQITWRVTTFQKGASNNCNVFEMTLKNLQILQPLG